MAEIITLDEGSFDTATGGDKPILVDFWAEWCGPCKLIAPVLEEIASETDLTIGKLNVDHHPGPASRNDVMSIPTLILFKGGEAKRRIVGAMPKHRLLQEIADYI